MPEVPFTLPKEKRHLDDEVNAVRSPLVDSHGADVSGTTMNLLSSPLADLYGAHLGGSTTNCCPAH
jgi:hypothetical protein